MRSFFSKYLAETCYLLVIITTPLSWKILSTNLVIFILAVAAGFIILRNYPAKYQPRNYLVLITIILTLLFIQFKNVNLQHQYSLNDYQKQVIQRRVALYPKGFKKLGNIFESNKEINVLRKIKSNFFEIFELKFLFWGNFLILSLPFFIIGIYLFFKKITKEETIFLFVILVINSILGIKNNFGLISLYPFFSSFIAIGVVGFFKKFL
ncbi:hypothetical protein HYS97_03370 [Candidatus Daviesbacteria bacterium]|nr:hypothetical protein [Candidatus Daviesbacteria bacterium]